MSVSYRTARRIVILVVGITVVLLGAVLLVVPGPGVLVLAAGLAILGLEFAFARRWLAKIRRGISGFGQNRRLRDRGHET